MRWLLGEWVLQHLVQSVNFGEITTLCTVNRGLGQVIAEHHPRIHRVHSDAACLGIAAL